MHYDLDQQHEDFQTEQALGVMPPPSALYLAQCELENALADEEYFRERLVPAQNSKGLRWSPSLSKRERETCQACLESSRAQINAARAKIERIKAAFREYYGEVVAESKGAA